jgi:hypothetical protein
MDSKYNRAVATYAVHLGEVAPNVPIFRFFPCDKIEDEAARLSLLYETIGLPFSKSISNFIKLVPLLEKRVTMLGGYPERLAVCLYLMGRKNDAAEFVEIFRRKEPTYFEKFAVAFLNFVSKDD